MPDAAIAPYADEVQQYVRRTFLNARMDDFSDPPAQDPDSFAALNNVIVGSRKRVIRRWGTTIFSNPTMNARRIFETHFSNGRNRFVLTASNASGALGPDNKIHAVNENGSLITNPILTPSTSAAHPEISTSRDYVFITDGRTADLKKWDTDDDPTSTNTSPETSAAIPSVTFNGILVPEPAGANGAMDATATAEGTGEISLVDGRAYTVIFRNSLAGTTSNIAPFTGRMGVTSNPGNAAVGVTIELTNIPISADPQVDQRIILATSDGGVLDTLYEVTRLNDNTTTSYTDEKAEDVLTASNLWAEILADGTEVGVIGNTSVREVAVAAADSAIGPTLSCVFRGRMFYAIGHFLYWSKNHAEVTTSTGNVCGRWEEAVPARNQTPISSNGSETITSLRTDDVALYIGTNRAVYVLDSDQPGLNPPRAIFQEVGVLNNAVWSTVYHEGHAVGAIWMTPDRRVIHSNFMTYRDIGNDADRGSAIQTALNALSTSVVTTATSTFIADGPHEFYVLCPGGSSLNTFWYHLKTGAWMRQFSSIASLQCFAVCSMYDSVNLRVLPVFSTVGQRLFRWNKDAVRDDTTDANTLPTPSIETVWLDFGDPTLTKTLNAVEVQSDESAITVTIYGANSEDQFDTPTTISTEPFFTNLGGQLFCPVADLRTTYRFFKFAFGGFTTSDETDVLSFLAIEFAPVGRI